MTEAFVPTKDRLFYFLDVQTSTTIQASIDKTQLSPDRQGPETLLDHPISTNRRQTFHIFIVRRLDSHWAAIHRLNRHRATLCNGISSIDDRQGVASRIIRDSVGDKPCLEETAARQMW